MTAVINPLIYHIVHLDRLASITNDGFLYSDELMSQRQNSTGTVIGMNAIKQRRLELPVGSLSRGKVGQYVPFYFCPRSIMLYLMYRADHPDLTYRGGQQHIIHLVSDFESATSWSDANKTSWAFTSSNAGAYYTQFFFSRNELSRLNWPAIANNDFRPPEVKEAKQSEFLVKDKFAWDLIKEIGVFDNATKIVVEQSLAGLTHRPVVVVHKEWYY